MQAQDVHDDILRHHRIAARRLHLAERDLRQLRMIDDVLHAGRTAEHGFQVREGGQRVEVRMHEREVLDVLHVARIRPEANLQIGKLLAKRIGPRRRSADDVVQPNNQ